MLKLQAAWDWEEESVGTKCRGTETKCRGTERGLKQSITHKEVVSTPSPLFHRSQSYNIYYGTNLAGIRGKGLQSCLVLILVLADLLGNSLASLACGWPEAAMVSVLGLALMQTLILKNYPRLSLIQWGPCPL